MNDVRREILTAAVKGLARMTGISALFIKEPTHSAHSRVDALLKIKTDRGVKIFAAAVKPVDRFRTPAQVKAQLAGHTDHPLLVAPFISRETAEHCRDLHLSFIDTAGNAFLEAPGLYVYVTGQPRPKSADKSRYRATSAAGLQVTFALLSRPALLQAPYREIAHAAATALGSITPVMRDLETRGFLIGQNRRRRLLDPEGLLQEWVTHFPIALRPKLQLRRFEAPAELLVQADLRSLEAYWGGERAAERLTGSLRPAGFTIYTQKSINHLVSALRLRAQPAGNLEVLKTFWHFESDPEYPDLVPPVLVYADLLSSHDGRNIEAAKQIYEQRIQPALHASKTSD